MRLAIDTETLPMLPGNAVPPLVCLSFSDGNSSGVVDRHEAPALVRQALEEGWDLVGHNFAFDVAVLSDHDPSLLEIFIDAYEDGRILDTMILRMLETIRNGTFAYNRKRFGLGHLAERYLGIPLNKGEDSWRLRYGELYDVPIDQWPAEAIEYAADDALTTHRLVDHIEPAPDLALQVRAHLALHCMGARGVRVDRQMVKDLELQLMEEYVRLHGEVVETGLVRPSGSQNKKAQQELVLAHLGTDAPRTAASRKYPDGQIKTDEDTMLRLVDVPEIANLLEYRKTGNLLSKNIPALQLGYEHPITPRFNVLVETGRTSCAKPNLQNLPRGDLIRPCFVPREGFVFAFCDMGAAELVALAQICWSWFGYSKLREAILAGQDLHLLVAANLKRVSYEEALAKYKAGEEEWAGANGARQFAKIANYGMAGGMGPASFVNYARGYNIVITEDFAGELRSAWLDTWIEMREYFRVISSLTGDLGPKSIEQVGSGRVRGNVRFTQAANGFFQSLVADCAKDLMWQVFKACYDPRVDSPLKGSYPELFVHDELILECPEDKAPEAAEELARLTVEVAEKWMPDVPMTADSALARRWYKGAKPVRDQRGRLQVWEPSKK